MLKIRRDCYEMTIQDAGTRLPHEGCGILSGKNDTVTTFYSMSNIDRSPVSYSMDPKEQFQVMKKIRESGEQMLGIYHSHVATRAFPSEKDVRLAFYPELHYVIVSLENRKHPLARAFRIEEGSVREDGIEIV